jgi:hypothetical protein
MRQRHVHLAPSRTVLGGAVRAVTLTIVLALTSNGTSAVAQTSECLELGPRKSPSWALLAEASKREICAQQEAVNEATRPVSASTIPPVSAGTPTLAPKPRLIDDGRTLILADEVRAPTNQRKPEIRLSTNETTGVPQVQVAGAGIAPLPTIAITCAWSRRSISLSDFSQGPLRNVASYDVHESIARMVRHETDCRISLAGSILPLPRDMVTIVWPTAP